MTAAAVQPEPYHLAAATLTADADELARALWNAALFASTDTTLPVLCVVHLRTVDGTLVAEATDRYTTGQAQIRTARNGLVEGMLLDARETAKAAKDIRAELKRRLHKRHQHGMTLNLAATEGADSVALTLVADGLTIMECHIGRREFPDGWCERTLDRNWDKLRKRVAKLDGMAFNRRWVIAAEWLARLGQVDDGLPGGVSPRVALQFTKTGGPVGVTIGEQFRALVMPVRGC